MLKSYLYLPGELDEAIRRTALAEKKSKAEILRAAIRRGLEQLQEERSASVHAMLKIATIGQSHTLKGPKDASVRMDELLWEKAGK